MLLGHLVDLRAKAGGKKSMPEKRETLEGLKVPSRKTRARGRKLRCLNPNPQRCNEHTRCYSAYRAAIPGAARSTFAGRHLRLARRWVTNLLKGMNGVPTSRLIRSAPTERGMA